MDQENFTRTLKQWLENDRRVVTYRDVSREAQCHVNLAKKWVQSAGPMRTGKGVAMLIR